MSDINNNNFDEEVLGNCEICQEKSQLKCSVCKKAFYCSSQHQKDHWKEHKKICAKPFEVCTSVELGRHLIATRQLNVDDVIFTEMPLIFGPRPHKLDSPPFPCVGCCKLLNENNFKQCPDCFWPCCDEKCSGLNTIHAFECRVLKLRPRIETVLKDLKLFFTYFRFDILVILRALHLQKLNKSKWDSLINLESHLDKRPREIIDIVQEQTNYLTTNYLNLLKEYEQETNQIIIPDCLPEIIHKIYGILDVNATEIEPSQEEGVEAVILYATASLVEHNCTPNTYQIIDKSDKFRITFKAALPIMSQEHITSIYTHILWGTQTRRNHLKESKYFDCFCTRCLDPSELGTYFSALTCLGGTEINPCGGTQLPLNPVDEKTKWICDKCKIELPNEEISKFVQHLGNEVDKVMQNRPKIEDLEDLLQKLLNFLHPNHYLIYTIKHSLIQMFGNDDEELSNALLEEKYNMCQELLEITRKLDPGNARLALYLAVILNEKLVVKQKFLQRNYEEEMKDKYYSEIKLILSLFNESKQSLRREMESEAGRKLFNVINRNEDKFLSWLQQNNISHLEFV